MNIEYHDEIKMISSNAMLTLKTASGNTLHSVVKAVSEYQNIKEMWKNVPQLHRSGGIKNQFEYAYYIYFVKSAMKHNYCQVTVTDYLFYGCWDNKKNWNFMYVGLQKWTPG